MRKKTLKNLFKITYDFAKRINRSDSKAKQLAKQTVKDFKKTELLFR